MKRVFLCVLDSFGIGALPDAELFGDGGANTLKSVSKSPMLKIPNLIKCGLGNIDGVDCLEKCDTPLGAFGRCMEKSMGKDTTVGHWEIAGLISEKPFPTYPSGFPEEIITELEKRTGRGIICNLPYSGTDVIRDYGEEHIRTGKLIVYTSADSVLQIASHEDVVDVETLYKYCRIAREIMQGEHGVGRVIARPFTTKDGKFVRTSDRRDFSIEPRGATLLDGLVQKGLDVLAVGKIKDIFSSRGITEHYPTHSNSEGIDTLLSLLDKDFSGLCFVNLVDFDMLYGHRNDVDGYAKALSYFDLHLPSILGKLRDDDLLIITADHGCDPGDTSTDHTREYTPLLVLGCDVKRVSLGTLDSFSSIASTIADCLGVKLTGCSSSFLNTIL
ncbi:MAG: phosphopentomutase [Clostridia bacterium]|nr:phosphopentomutase [Clostridia bacterium]